MKQTSLSPNEIAKFESMADDWWSPEGKFKPLHDITPLRMKFIKDQFQKHFKSDSMKDIYALDIGCGGGLVTECLARLKFNVLGIDASEINIKIASDHAKNSNLKIDYQKILAEDLAKTGKKFQLITALEIVEHVENLEFFIKNCCKLLSPGGLIIFSTINRCLESYFKSIIAAEYLLRWLPIGTHDWSKFVKPSELNYYINIENGKLLDLTGLSYSVLSNDWSFSENVSNNYFMVFTL